MRSPAWRSRTSRGSSADAGWRLRVPQADVDLAFDEVPLSRVLQPPDELFEPGGVLGREREPGQEVERLGEVPAVVEPSSDRG